MFLRTFYSSIQELVHVSQKTSFPLQKLFNSVVVISIYSENRLELNMCTLSGQNSVIFTANTSATCNNEWR
jgi:hypothetical protein